MEEGIDESQNLFIRQIFLDSPNEKYNDEFRKFFEKICSFDR